MFCHMRMGVVGLGPKANQRGAETWQGCSGSCRCSQQLPASEGQPACLRVQLCSRICSRGFFFFQPSVKVARGFSAVRGGGYPIVYFPGVFFSPLSLVTNFVLLASPLSKPLLCPLPLYLGPEPWNWP